MTKIDRATPEDIYSVALNMRERDFAEFSAVNMANTREDLASSLAARYGALDILIVAHKDGDPIAVGGAVEVRPNVVSLMFMATDRFEEVVLPVSKFIRRRLFPSLKAQGIHRIECATLEGYQYSYSWLKMLGLSQEVKVMRAFGKNKENFSLFAKAF